MVFLLTLTACIRESSKDSSDSSTEPLEEGPPNAPGPFVLETSGEEILSLSFSEPACSSPDGSTQLRGFWRDSSHSFVLGIDIMEQYEGVGTYTSDNLTVRARLQEEAGGQARYFATSEGVEATISWAEDDLVAGTFQVSTMSEGGLILSPTSFPIWCTDL
ncbi:MAG: hypothetical protein CMK59_06800 [Proteobacteria bacterium]|nr:hypothetical protein [Pseudomonadota bacterium]